MNPESMFHPLINNEHIKWESEELKKTPERVFKAWEELLSGYNQDPEQILKSALFRDNVPDQMIVINDISFYSVCAHHLLPFFGVVHVGYIPGSCYVGLSKFARCVRALSLRLQVQERLTTQILNAIRSAADPKGVVVQIEARHLCQSMRGARTHSPSMKTSAVYGAFAQKMEARQEFMDLLKSRRERSVV